MFLYIVLTCCTKVCVLTARKPYCSFTQVIRVVMSIFAQSLERHNGLYMAFRFLKIRNVFLAIGSGKKYLAK